MKYAQNQNNCGFLSYILIIIRNSVVDFALQIRYLFCLSHPVASVVMEAGNGFDYIHRGPAAVVTTDTKAELTERGRWGGGGGGEGWR